MRQIDSARLHQSFEPYDIKSSGFISIDAFHSVMRKLDIFLPADVSSSVISRFTAVSGEKFDYVDFGQVVASGLQPKPMPPQVHPTPVQLKPMTLQVQPPPPIVQSTPAVDAVRAAPPGNQSEQVAATQSSRGNHPEVCQQRQIGSTHR